MASTTGSKTSSKRHMKKRRVSWLTSWLTRDKKALVWGLGFILLGLVTIFGTTLFEERHLPPNDHRRLVEFVGHVGIAFLLLGIVAVIIEFKNWRDYFEERLQNTIKKKEFLRTLETEQLNLLLKEVFQAYYKVEDLDRNSFHDFFSTKIKPYFGKPFRENTSSVITVQPSDKNDGLVVEEDLRYTCRKIAALDALLQNEIKSFFDESDLYSDFEKYTIRLGLPEKDSWPKCFVLKDDFKAFFDKDRNEWLLEEPLPPMPKELSVEAQAEFTKQAKEKEAAKKAIVEKHPRRYGFRLSLEEFVELEWLQVHLYKKYTIKTDRFLAWSMAYLSSGFQVVFNYPEKDFDIQVEPFGMDPDPANLTITEQPGIYSLNYNSWLLPETGLAFRFMKKTHKSAKDSAPELKLAENADHGREGVEVPRALAQAAAASTADHQVITNRSVRAAPNGEFDDNRIKEGYDQFRTTQLDR
jgi:hypothetical protein